MTNSTHPFIIIQAEVVQTIFFTGQISTNSPVLFSTKVKLFQHMCKEGARNYTRVYCALGISVLDLLLKDSYQQTIEKFKTSKVTCIINSRVDVLLSCWTDNLNLSRQKN